MVDPQKPRLEGLTTLRFFAAALVVFTHWNSETFRNAPEWIQTFILNGYWAVSFFFALSGFILTYTYIEKPCRRWVYARLSAVSLRRMRVT